jgi:hypothetical protein
MAAPTYMDITSPGSIQAQATTTFSLAIGSIYSFTALSASTSGVTLNGTTTIGTGTGTAVLTSGVVSTLSGTNLVLGNGSTIPQSTFAPASGGNYLPLAGGSITSATGIQIPFNNSTTNTIGIGSAANFGSNNFELGVSIPSASSHWPFGIVKGGTMVASIDNNGNFIATAATLTGALAGTSTSMSGTITANSPGTYGGGPSLYVPYYPPNGAGNYGLQVGQTSDLGSVSYAGIGIGVQSGRTGNAIQVGSGGSALMYVSSTGAITSNATGTAISVPNGSISIGGTGTALSIPNGNISLGINNCLYLGASTRIQNFSGATGFFGFGNVWEFGLSNSVWSSPYSVSASFFEGIDLHGASYGTSLALSNIFSRSSYNRNTSATLGNVTVSALYSVISLEPGSSNPTTLASIPNGTVDGQQLTLTQNAPATCVVSSSNLVATFSLTAGSSRNLTWNAANSKWL